jgi:hypothetical protein
VSRYTNISLGTWSVIAAAQAEQAQRMMREEEEMTQYSDSDIAGDWEFKIVRAASGVFRKPEEFARLLEQESQFGWTLLEKLDDGRVRFKRHVKERSRDSRAGPGEDPYRSIYGRSPGKQAGLIILGVLLAMVAFMWILFAVLP